MFPGFPVEVGGVVELHAVLSRSRVTGNPGSPQRTWAENDFFECFCFGSGLLSREPYLEACSEKPSKGLRPHRFRPTYAVANVGHPSGTLGGGEYAKFSRFPHKLFGQSLTFRSWPPSTDEGAGKYS